MLFLHHPYLPVAVCFDPATAQSGFWISFLYVQSMHLQAVMRWLSSEWQSQKVQTQKTKARFFFCLQRIIIMTWTTGRSATVILPNYEHPTHDPKNTSYYYPPPIHTCTGD